MSGKSEIKLLYTKYKNFFSTRISVLCNSRFVTKVYYLLHDPFSVLAHLYLLLGSKLSTELTLDGKLMKTVNRLTYSRATELSDQADAKYDQSKQELRVISVANAKIHRGNVASSFRKRFDLFFTLPEKGFRLSI